MSRLPFALLRAIELATQSPHHGGINKARLGHGRADGFWNVFERDFPEFSSATQEERYDALWTLLRQGLISIEMRGAPHDWLLHPTELGLAAVNDPDVPPEDVDAYRAELNRAIPGASIVTRRYAHEAHQVYQLRAYFACAVMLGCASESVVVELIDPLADWLDSVDPGSNFRRQIKSAKQMSDKLRTIRNAVEPKRRMLPPGWQDDLEIRFDAIASALRVYRNEAGHPAIKGIDHGAARDLLIILPDYLRRLYELREWLIAETPLGSPPPPAPMVGAED